MNDAARFCERAIAYLKVPAPSSENEITVSSLDEPVLRDLKNGLLVAYLVDEGSRFAYVQRRHLADAGISSDALHGFGISNLAQIAKDRLRVQEYGPAFAIFLDGNFEASLILIDSLWSDALSPLVKDGFAVAIPTRDVLAFCDVSSTQGLTELRAIVSRLENGDHLLTPVLYRREGECWSRYAA